MDGPTFWQTQATLWQHRAEDSMVRIVLLTTSRNNAWMLLYGCLPFVLWKFIDLGRWAVAFWQR